MVLRCGWACRDQEKMNYQADLPGLDGAVWSDWTTSSMFWILDIFAISIYTHLVSSSTMAMPAHPTLLIAIAPLWVEIILFAKT